MNEIIHPTFTTDVNWLTIPSLEPIDSIILIDHLLFYDILLPVNHPTSFEHTALPLHSDI